MNERIEELMVEASNGACYDGNIASLYDADIEKFAELIVRETLQVARAGMEFGDGMEDAVYRYFGVE